MKRDVPIAVLVLALEVLLLFAAWYSLEAGNPLLPPTIVFFTLDHALFVALVAFILCAIDYGVRRTPLRFVCAVIALILILVSAAEPLARR